MDDPWLKELLADEPVDDDGFSAAVASRVRAHGRSKRRGERWATAAPVLIAVGSAAICGWWLPSPLEDAGGSLIQGFVGLMLCLGLGGALWLDTEPADPLS